MSPHPHKIFKLALPEDAVCSACGFMLSLDGPQAPSTAGGSWFDSVAQESG